MTKVYFKNMIYCSTLGTIILWSSEFFANRFVAHSVISIRTYFAYLILYMIFSLLMALIILLIGSRFLKRESKDLKSFFIIHSFILLFVFDFVLINLKLNGWFRFSNLRAIVDNSMLILGFVVIFLLFLKYKWFKNTFGNFLNCSIALFIAFLLTNYFNYGFMHWSFPPEQKIKVIAFTFVILVIPFLSAGIVNLFAGAFKKFGQSESWLYIGTIVVCIVFLLFPIAMDLRNWSEYNFTQYKTSGFDTERYKQKYPVFLIVMDTARRDHFSCYGYDRKTTPAIDELAKDGILFTNFISTSPWTLPSHASLFTGLFSASHGAHHVLRDFPYRPLSRRFDTLAEIMQQAGYKTAGFVSNVGVVNRKNNFDQGFNFFYDGTASFYVSFWGSIFQNMFTIDEDIARYFQINKYMLSSEIFDIGIKWYKKETQITNQPIFMFFNLMEPHDGIFYLPDNFEHRYDFSWDKWPQINKDLIYRFERNLSPEQQQVLFDWYDCKLSYMDQQLKKFFDYLKHAGIYDEALIVLLSDHGELFGEHNTFGHQKDLYNELIWTPLIIKYPSELRRSGIVEKYVQTVDILPEILKILQIPIRAEVQGQPISEIDHEIISELYEKKHPLNRFQRGLKAIFCTKDTTDYKLLLSTNGKNELYDFLNDPQERINLYQGKKKIAKELTDKLLTWYATIKKPSEEQTLDKETKNELIDKLKTLGYIR